MSRVGDEISPKQTFARFKQFVEHEPDTTMAQLLPVLKQQAATYRQWMERASDPHADLDTVELSVYRLQTFELELLKPILIWLHEPGRDYDRAVVDRVVQAVESWIIRRALLRLTTSDLGRIVADLIKIHRSTPQADLVDRVTSYLSRLNVASTYWPGDVEIKNALVTDAAYRRFKRSRMRVFLEAAEDDLRGYNGTTRPTGGRVARVGYPIEHVMPQKWQTHWPVDDLAAEINRRDHVHRLGNLTLLTSSLNSSVSNSAWLGDRGKRVKLREHDVFLLNRRIEDVSSDGWDEGRIDQRTTALIRTLLVTWPVPAGHAGEVKDAPPAAAAMVTLKQLIAAGHLVPGTVLSSRPGTWGDHEAVVLDNGDLSLDGRVFNSPSAAGHHLRKGATNGWYFWILPDGRRLADLRETYRAEG
jgi:hypothetical protein